MGNYWITIWLIIIAVSISQPASAFQKYPSYWPWRGITLFCTASAPDDIYLINSRLKINTVRLDLNVRLLASREKIESDVAWAKCMQWADNMLNACRNKGIGGIISISQFPIDPSLSLNQDSSGFWNNPQHLAEVVRLAGVMGSRFKSRGKEFLAYEIISEPLLRENNKVMKPPMWPDLQQKIIREIRKYDSERIFIINPAPGGSPKAYDGFSPINNPKLIYGAHMYLPQAFTHQGIRDLKLGYEYPGMIFLKQWNKAELANSLSYIREFQLNNNVLIWIGEFSAVRWAPGAEQYLLDLTDIFKEYGWGWAYFAYKEYHGWNPDFDALYSTDKRDDWQSHYIGENSSRWNTLKKMFNK